MPVITILIAAAIAAGVSYALHFLGEDNNRKESVKKYADKRQAEIATFINEQVKHLSDSTASLETKQMQAAAAIKRLESQIKEFNAVAENLKDDTDSVKNIEQKIKSYDDVLQELFEMTEKLRKTFSL